MAIVVSCDLIRNRVFNDSGEEVDSQYQKIKKERAGFLNKYDHVEQEDPEAWVLFPPNVIVQSEFYLYEVLTNVKNLISTV